MNEAHRSTPSGLLRARAIGIPFDGEPGAWNAITDVPGVEVGYRTLVSGDGPLRVGEGPVRTGVTAVLPRGRAGAGTPVFAGIHSLNGAGELTGAHWVEESGQCEGPVTITNTHSCGIARDATVRWCVRHVPSRVRAWGLPIAGETYDGHLNDINGFHVTADDVEAAIDAAASGPIEQGSVGGGTGMIVYDWKGGSGSASRRVRTGDGDFTVGVFVQANFGWRSELVVAGIAVGRELRGGEIRDRVTPQVGSSVIALVATDAPLLPHQCKRLARRVTLGLARSGTVSHNGSGDLFLAFSTANAAALDPDTPPAPADFLANERLDPLFAAVVQATDEAVIDSMVANRAMTGRDGTTVQALPHDAVRALLARHGVLRDPG